MSCSSDEEMSASPPQVLKEKALRSFEQGAYQQALAEFQLALTAFAKDGDEIGQAEILNNLGVLHRLLGKTQSAIEALRQSEVIFARLGDEDRQGQALGNLGDVYASGRQRDNAARCYSDAAAIFARVGDGERQSQVLRALSLLRLRQGKWLAAMMHMEESLRVRPRLGPLQLLFRGLLRFALGLLTRS
jgi:tetratricopeptide (TPR) repeat protein